ncbi:MAG: serine/threonine protein kinase [Gammaproteobacteria bacterium]
MISDSADHAAYRELGPDQVLDAVDASGFLSDGRLLALNSYENRVYQVGLDEGEPVVAKFYRPGRWSDEAILEEHQLTLTLADAGLPVVPPLVLDGARTLVRAGNFRLALYARRGGRAPELDNLDNLEILGRFMARMHALGEASAFQHRPTLTVEGFGDEARDLILSGDWLPGDLREAYERASADALVRVREAYRRAGEVRYLRLHGDAHPGNILWRDDLPHFVDFDDSRMGPAVQDLWMFLSGDREDRSVQLDALLEGYTQFREFDAAELNLVEALRTLRIMHHAAWIARRWDDPAFPLAFPHFGDLHYWEEHILALKEQMAAMDEAPLRWGFNS